MSEPDHAWILARERGGVSHVPEKVRARYEELAALIQSLPDESPSEGWKARVVAAIDEPPRGAIAPPCWPKPRCSVWLAAVLGIATSSAIVIAWHGRVNEKPKITITAQSTGGTAARTPATSLLKVEIRHPDQPVRGGERTHVASSSSPRDHGARIGDTLILHLASEASVEVRVYDPAGDPLARCSAALSCGPAATGDGTRLRLEIPLLAPGAVRVVELTGAAIPPAFQSLKADLAAAHRASIAAQQVAVVYVR
jgi:hypothetical protein